MDHYRVRNSLPRDAVRSEMNIDQNLTRYFFKIEFNVIRLSRGTRGTLKWILPVLSP